MQIDEQILKDFEAGLEPEELSRSPVPARILGFGEISAIFVLEPMEKIAFKRMPLFRDETAAAAYSTNYREYCRWLANAGLLLPEDDTRIIACPEHPVCLYIAQQRFPAELFGHRLIHTLPPQAVAALLTGIIQNIKKIWDFNQANHKERELSLDGQISNWVLQDKTLYFIDTSTPMFRLKGQEQLDPELLLQSAPGFLRWILRWFFLEDVMNRYYDLRLVYMDLVANLYKEQRPDLIPDTISLINLHLPADIQPLTPEEVRKYYRSDRIIWSLFLAFRRFDRALTKKLFKQRYEFILPGKIKR